MQYKQKGTAWILFLFLGGLGIHKFYLNKVGWGLFYLFVMPGFIWAGIFVIWAGIFGGWGFLFIPLLIWIIDLFTLNAQVEKANIALKKMSDNLDSYSNSQKR